MLLLTDMVVCKTLVQIISTDSILRKDLTIPNNQITPVEVLNHITT